MTHRAGRYSRGYSPARELGAGVGAAPPDRAPAARSHEAVSVRFISALKHVPGEGGVYLETALRLLRRKKSGFF